MAFCSFSKEFNENAYTSVENQFITKYLPDADAFAVKVYLYGLYLCQNNDSDFNIFSMAEVLKTTPEKIAEAFSVWEDYDLVSVISRDPFAVSYLPVRSAVGRPKKIRYEQYADFNKELQCKMQQIGKFVSYNDSIKYMHFLQDNSMQPHALLLIAEYCINKQGENVSPAYIFNKAKKFIRNGWLTYEQVERELSSYNANEKDLTAVLTALSPYAKKPDESDYALYAKWTEKWGFNKAGILEAAKHLKKGTTENLDLLLADLAERGKTEEGEIGQFLTEREILSALTFRIAKKLGVKMGNPAPYIDEYVGKWYNYGYEESSLSDLALYCLKTNSNDFNAMDGLISTLFAAGIVSTESVGAYLARKNDELKLFTRIGTYCGNLKKSAANLALIGTWHSWDFSDEMILEAAKRSAGSGNPIPYMNKILSEWKHQGITSVKEIPEKTAPQRPVYTNPAVEAVNAKADREHYYALLRERAQATADKYRRKADAVPRFKELSSELAKVEIEQAKAEIFAPDTVTEIIKKRARLKKERAAILASLNITEAQLLPAYTCKKCSDTGFLPSGEICNCYKPDLPQAPSAIGNSDVG